MKKRSAYSSGSLYLYILIAICILKGGCYSETVSIHLGETCAIPRSLYGFNCNLMKATAFYGVTYGSPEIQRAIRQMRPNGLRFPGGTIANSYLWKQDSFAELKNDLTGWAGKQIDHFCRTGKSYGLPDYTNLCKSFELEPVWVLNIFEETPESIAALLDYFDQIGLHVKSVEMGNEPYWDSRSLNNVWTYIQFCKPLVNEFRKRKPNIQIGACFAPLRSKPYNYIEKWNAVLAKENWYDAVVFHDYYGGQGIALEMGQELPAEALLYPEILIDKPVMEFSKLIPDKPIWFTEWNMGSDVIKQWKNKGAELLFLGATYTRLIKHRNSIEKSFFHQIYQKSFGTFYYDSGDNVIKTAASYEFFKLLGVVFYQADHLKPVKFSDNSVIGFATICRGSKRLFAINRGDRPITFQLPKGFTEAIEQLTIECPPEKLLPLSTELIQRGKLRNSDIILPAYSISVVASNSDTEM